MAYSPHSSQSFALRFQRRQAKLAAPVLTGSLSGTTTSFCGNDDVAPLPKQNIGRALGFAFAAAFAALLALGKTIARDTRDDAALEDTVPWLRDLACARQVDGPLHEGGILVARSPGACRLHKLTKRRNGCGHLKDAMTNVAQYDIN